MSLSANRIRLRRDMRQFPATLTRGETPVHDADNPGIGTPSVCGRICRTAIEQQHGHSRNNRSDVGQAAIDELTHDVGASREHQERDHREWQGDTEHDLTYDQRIGRIRAKGDDNESRYHRYQSPNQDRDPEPDESLHDDLAGHCSNRRTRNSRCNKGDQEHTGCPDAQQGRQGVIGRFDLRNVAVSSMKSARCHHHHRHVDQAGDNQCDDDFFI